MNDSRRKITGDSVIKKNKTFSSKLDGSNVSSGLWKYFALLFIATCFTGVIKEAFKVIFAMEASTAVGALGISVIIFSAFALMALFLYICHRYKNANVRKKEAIYDRKLLGIEDNIAGSIEYKKILKSIWSESVCKDKNYSNFIKEEGVAIAMKYLLNIYNIDEIHDIKKIIDRINDKRDKLLFIIYMRDICYDLQYNYNDQDRSLFTRLYILLKDSFSFPDPVMIKDDEFLDTCKKYFIYNKKDIDNSSLAIESSTSNLNDADSQSSLCNLSQNTAA